MGERLAKLLAGLTVAMGVAVVLVGLSVFVEAWQASRAWAGSSEALQANTPAEEPIWLDAPVGPAPQAGGAALTSQPPELALTPQPPLPASTNDEAPPLRGIPVSGEGESGLTLRPSVSSVGEGPPIRRGAAAVQQGAEATSATVLPPLPRAAEGGWAGEGYRAAEDVQPGDGHGERSREREGVTASEIELNEIDFRFLDPPEPGAHARLAVTLRNGATLPTGPVSLLLPARWLQSFEVFGAIPAVLEDRADGEGERRFVFGGLAPREQRTVELHVLATAEEVEAPDVRILLSDDAEIGRARPRTVAPRPRPGPARAVIIPKLGVRASVVTVPWEPPPFVVGQVQGTAAVSEGNTVLIGHLAGPGGDVFARLDRLRPGDEVVAMSRGLEYRFVVSEIAVRPYDDVLATQATTTPRLTLMTCTGQWSIARQDYSHRVWIVAEPPELAQQTIRANAERAAQAAREAEAAAAARAAHEATVTQSAIAQPDPAAAGSGLAEAPRATPTDAGGDGAASPAPDRALPLPPPAVGAAERASVEIEALVPGIAIDRPADREGVARRFTVHGRRTVGADPHAPLWLVARAEVAGSRWYALDRALAPGVDGAWAADVELGGPAGVRHEIRVGFVDAAGDAALRRHAAERSGQPLTDLPDGFKTAARVVVERR